MLGLSCGAGFIGAAAIYGLWYYKNTVSIALLTVGMTLGVVLASLAFASPLGVSGLPSGTCPIYYLLFIMRWFFIHIA